MRLQVQFFFVPRDHFSVCFIQLRTTVAQLVQWSGYTLDKYWIMVSFVTETTERSLLHLMYTVSVPDTSFYLMDTGDLFPTGRATGHEVDQLPPFAMRFNREWSCTSTPPDAFMAWTHWPFFIQVSHWDFFTNYIFTFNFYRYVIVKITKWLLYKLHFMVTIWIWHWMRYNCVNHSFKCVPWLMYYVLHNDRISVFRPIFQNLYLHLLQMTSSFIIILNWLIQKPNY